MRKHTLAVLYRPAPNSVWGNVVEEIEKKHNAEFDEGIYCQFGFNEEIIVLMELESDDERGTLYHVGIGDLGPYTEVYTGHDCEQASKMFTTTINEKL